MRRLASLSLLALVSTAGCEGEVYESGFVMLWPRNVGNRCGETPDTPRGEDAFPSIDTYVIDVFEFVDGDRTPRTQFSGACGRCALGEATCRHVQRRCTCGGPFDNPLEYQRVLAGVRFTNLDPDADLCIRLTAFERPSPTGPADEMVACDELCAPGPDASSAVPGGEVRFCMISQLGSVSSAGPVTSLTELACPTIDNFVDRCDRFTDPDTGIFDAAACIEAERMDETCQMSAAPLLCAGTICAQADDVCTDLVRLAECTGPWSET